MKDDPITFLVKRRFPDYERLRLPPDIASLGNGGRTYAEQQRRLDEAKQYREELCSKSVEELNALLEDAKQQQLNERLREFEQIERQRFYNQPNAVADFGHWSKAVYWSLDEAIALSFGKAPEVVTWTKLESFLGSSAFARQYSRVRDLATRAKNWGQLYDPVVPGIYLAWARRVDVVVPAELVTAVEARGIVVADWKDLYDKLDAKYAEVYADREKLIALCREQVAERDGLIKRVADLQNEVEGWQFDESSDNYPPELDVAMQAWRAVSKNRESTQTIKQQLQSWLAKNYPKLSDEARERIATVANWGKRGGRPAQN